MKKKAIFLFLTICALSISLLHNVFSFGKNGGVLSFFSDNSVNADAISTGGGIEGGVGGGDGSAEGEGEGTGAEGCGSGEGGEGAGGS